jgi:hypothetical protein
MTSFRDRHIMVMATGLKFLRDTPEKIRGKIIDYVLFNDENNPLPVSLQPYKKNMNMLKQHTKAVELSMDNSYTDEEKSEVNKEFEDISEDEFVDLYRDWRTRRDDTGKSPDSRDTQAR